MTPWPRAVPSGVKRIVLALLVLCAGSAPAQTRGVWITEKPRTLVFGSLTVPVLVSPEVVRTELLINGVKAFEESGRPVNFSIPIGKYIRRLRVRAVGYDADDHVVGSDEMVINDPQPPFRVHLQAPPALPEGGRVQLSANVIAPLNARVEGVDFFVNEVKIGTDTETPYTATFTPAEIENALYARVVARASGGLEANDIAFWGSDAGEIIDVIVKQIPMSVAGAADRQALRPEEFTLNDNGAVRKIEAITPASDQPLNVIVLMDSSQSMLEELPVVKQAARDFARALIRPQDRIAMVGFHQHTFWLTPFTSDMAMIDQAVERLQPKGETHLYDAVIEMLYELQKMPGRRALVVLTDGVNQGGDFTLDHLVHYARYSGVPVYPIVKNKWLSRYLKLGLGGFQAKRFAEIARDSGATWFLIEKPAQLPVIYRRIAEELRQQYLLMFYTESTGNDAWHGLRLTPSHKGLRVRIPRGYFP